ncbi:hypothetical protein X753_31150 [Mesorhizobium sp. LNJC399B00]|nr:hypothetical protein X753_31150 [Mesorhizobium sp. LNJC399B00]
MRDTTIRSEAAWQEEDLSAAGLPDKRLARRLQRLLGSDVSCAGQANPGGLRRLGAGEASIAFLTMRV